MILVNVNATHTQVCTCSGSKVTCVCVCVIADDDVSNFNNTCSLSVRGTDWETEEIDDVTYCT